MSDSVQNLIAEPEDKGTRIDKYLSQELEDVSRSRIQKLLDDGDITVDDKCVKSNYKLNGTEHITITIPELIVPQILPENIPLNIIYEDDDVILIDKPREWLYIQLQDIIQEQLSMHLCITAGTICQELTALCVLE